MKKVILLSIVSASVFVSGCASLQKDPSQKYLDGIVSAYDLPPAPSKKSEDSLAGVDVNENGVRDDVERDLYLLYDVLNHKEHYPELINYQMDVARKFQDHLLSEDPVESSKAAIESIRTMNRYVVEVNNTLYNEDISVPEISYLPEKEVMWIANNLKRYVFDTPQRKMQFELQSQKISNMVK